MSPLQAKIEEIAQLMIDYRQSPLSPHQRMALERQTVEQVTATLENTRAALVRAARRDPNSPMFDPAALRS